jgi:pSer/pThr/pTyr-binding forkhead associated (FHA) protein
MHIEIYVTAGPAKGQHFIFTKPTWFLIGRETDAQISLPDDPYISRRHCLLKLFPSECLLRDLDSTNGVLVNGVQYGGKISRERGEKQASQDMTEVCLNNEDEIVIGDTRVRIFINPSSQSALLKELAAQKKKALSSVEQSKEKSVDTLCWQDNGADASGSSAARLEAEKFLKLASSNSRTHRP